MSISKTAGWAPNLARYETLHHLAYMHIALQTCSGLQPVHLVHRLPAYLPSAWKDGEHVRRALCQHAAVQSSTGRHDVRLHPSCVRLTLWWSSLLSSGDSASLYCLQYIAVLRLDRESNLPACCRGRARFTFATDSAGCWQTTAARKARVVDLQLIWGAKGHNKLWWTSTKRLVFLFFYFFYFYNCIVPMGFLPWEIRVAFPGESQRRQIRATQPRVHAGYFSVSIIHRTLTWTMGSLTCAQMQRYAIAHGGVRTS